MAALTKTFIDYRVGKHHDKIPVGDFEALKKILKIHQEITTTQQFLNGHGTDFKITKNKNCYYYTTWV